MLKNTDKCTTAPWVGTQMQFIPKNGLKNLIFSEVSTEEEKAYAKLKLSPSELAEIAAQKLDEILNKVTDNSPPAIPAIVNYTRARLREDSFAERIITPIDISNDEYDQNTMIEEKAAPRKKGDVTKPKTKPKAVRDPDKEFKEALKSNDRMLEL